MDESVNDLHTKLEKNKQQLKKVKNLLSSQKENETLKTLKRDLEQVIKLTTELLNLKEGKVVAYADDKSERSIAPSIPVNLVKYQKRKAPREWGEEKDKWKKGERCQVKVHGRWELGVVRRREQDTIDNKVMWEIDLLEKRLRVSAHKSRMRTYVIPLQKEISIGQEVKALHNGMFQRGMVEDLNKDEGRYRISFLRTGQQALVPLQDLQLAKFKTQKMSKDGKGFWHVAEPIIPKTLELKASDSQEQRTSKKKRRKQIRKEHNLLLKKAAQQNRRNNWQEFQLKIKKKSKKKIGIFLSTFKTKSIFASPKGLNQMVGRGHGSKIFL